MDIQLWFSLLKQKGGKGSSRVFSANTRGTPSGIDPRSVAMKHNNTSGGYPCLWILSAA